MAKIKMKTFKGIAKATEPEEDLRTVDSIKYLECRFDEAELSQFGREQATTFKEVDQLRADKKSAMAEFDVKIKTAEAKMMLLSGYITTGKTWKHVECEETMDKPHRNTKTVCRKDTGEIWTEPMTDADKQGDLFN